MNRCCSPNMGRRDADKPVFPIWASSRHDSAAGTCVKPVFSGSMGGASKASQSGLCKSTIGLCQCAIGLCDRQRQRRMFMQNVNLRFFKIQTAPDPENRGRCALSKAYCLASSSSAVGLPVFSIMIRQSRIVGGGGAEGKWGGGEGEEGEGGGGGGRGWVLKSNDLAGLAVKQKSSCSTRFLYANRCPLRSKTLRNPQSRYRIWSVQKRSRRCSDLFSVANSSFEMPPTCSTVLTCFW